MGFWACSGGRTKLIRGPANHSPTSLNMFFGQAKHTFGACRSTCNAIYIFQRHIGITIPGIPWKPEAPLSRTLPSAHPQPPGFGHPREIFRGSLGEMGFGLSTHTNTNLSCHALAMFLNFVLGNYILRIHALHCVNN